MARRTLLAIALLPCLLSCDEEGIHAYRAPKPPAPKLAAAPAAGSVVWDVPQGWQEAKSDQTMRVATFKPGADGPEISVSAFAGDSGGLLSNINRWRGQLKLDPIDEAALPQTLETSEIAGVKVSLADITGRSGQEMLGAVITPGDGQTWFVKATGEPPAISALKPSFAAFARSFRLAAGATPAAAPTPAPTTPTGQVQARLTTFKPPATWNADAKASAMVAAAFDASTADGPARITATMLMNNGGGVLANINRWRDQLKLPAVAGLDQQPVTDLGHGNLIVDLTSADGAQRLMAAIVASEGQTWFFKITGPPKAVEAERRAYESMVRSVGLGETAP